MPTVDVTSRPPAYGLLPQFLPLRFPFADQLVVPYGLVRVVYGLVEKMSFKKPNECVLSDLTDPDPDQ